MKAERDNERRAVRLIAVAGKRYEIAAPAIKRKEDAADAALAVEAATMALT